MAVIIVFGLPGSGKSYFGERLAAAIDAGYVNSDRIRKTLFDDRTYSAAEKSAVYDEMLAQTREYLHKGRHVVVDATFHSHDTRQRFVASLAGSDVHFIEVWAEDALARQRVQKPRPWSEAGPDVYALIKAQWEPLATPHLRLQSTDTNIDEMLTQATKWLDHDTGTDTPTAG